MGICIFDAVIGESPANMAPDSGTPIAGVLAGTTYATAIASSLQSHSNESEKHVTVQSA